MKKLILAAFAASLLAGAAAAHPAKDPQAIKCFYTRDLRNHSVGDAHTLYFDVNGRSVYRVEMSNNCLATATSSDPLVMRNFTGSPQICHPLDLDISVNGERCLVKGLSKLTPEEAAALPRRVRP